MDKKKFYISPEATMIRVECVMMNVSGGGPEGTGGGTNPDLEWEGDEEPETSGTP